MKFDELKGKSDFEKKDIVLKTKREIMNIRFRKSQGDNTNVKKLSGMRKTIARIKTIESFLIKQNKG